MKRFPAFAALQHEMGNYARSLHSRSRAIVAFLYLRMSALALAWLALSLLLGLAKIATALSPVHGWADLAELALPYMLIAIAPVAGYLVATGSFPRWKPAEQPSVRLARYGKWTPLEPAQARANPAYGPTGFMASLLIGMLLNIVVRTFEFMVAVPAMNSHAPGWGQAIFHVMAADVIVMNFFYMVCFVMALRSVPLFPRMLLYAWTIDITMQLIVARHVANHADLPPLVATGLLDLLQGNVTKVLISAFVWLPYLMLSERVNVTYRCRSGARG